MPPEGPPIRHRVACTPSKALRTGMSSMGLEALPALIFLWPTLSPFPTQRIVNAQLLTPTNASTYCIMRHCGELEVSLAVLMPPQQLVPLSELEFPRTSI